MDNSKLIIKSILNNDLIEFERLTRPMSPLQLINTIDEYKNNLLHLSVSMQNIPVIRFLIAKGLDKHQKNAFSQSAWEIAIKSQNENIIQTLIDNHTDLINELKKELQILRHTETEYKLLNVKLNTKLDDLTKSHDNEAKVYSQKLDDVNRKCKLNSDDNDRLTKKNKTLTEENLKLFNDNQKIKRNHQKMTDDHQRLIIDYDQLIINNQKLTKTNHSLQTSVNSLIGSNRK